MGEQEGRHRMRTNEVLLELYGRLPDLVRPESADVLVAYYGAVAERTTAFLDTLTEADLDRVVDERWDPPVTLGVRLVSVADDDLEHVGQAAYVRGVLRARDPGG